MLHRLPAYSVGFGSHLGWSVDARTEFSAKGFVELGRLNYQNVHVQGYVTSLSEDGKNRESLNSGKSTKEWAALKDAASIASDSCQDALRKSNIDSWHDALGKKNIDVTTLGNLCVDIVLNVPSLPPSTLQEKFAYMTKLAESSPDKRYWEAGGASNVAIAAARLGLHCVALGHLGNEKYGSFLHEVLEDEGVQVVGLEDDRAYVEHVNGMEETVLCWVLVDPEHRHGFCSRCDFNKEPVFNWVKELPVCAKAVIRRSKVLLCNGFLFDELSPSVITSAVDFANKAGCVVFFDPGPRGKSLFLGSGDQQQALQKLLSLSDVLLLTADEAEALTGVADPVLSAKRLLDRGQCTKWVIIKMGDKGCLMVTGNDAYRVPAFKVDVVDTVGCGDSFAAAVALGYTRRFPVAGTLALANAVGAATAMGCGAGRNVATMDDVIKILLSSKLCNENDEAGQIQAFSVEQLMTVGKTDHFSDYSTHGVNCASLSIPFHVVAHEVVDLLKSSTQGCPKSRTSTVETLKDSS